MYHVTTTIITVTIAVSTTYGQLINRKDYGFPPTSVSDFFTPRHERSSFGQDIGPSIERDVGNDFGQDIGPNLRTEIGPYNGQHQRDFGPSFGSSRFSDGDDFQRRNGYPYLSPGHGHYYNREPVDSSKAYYGGHFGQPTGSAEHSGPPDFDSDRSLTPEELDSKKHNPIPFLINPLIRRGTQGLQRFEANFVRDPKKNQIVKPLLALLTNPSKKR